MKKIEKRALLCLLLAAALLLGSGLFVFRFVKNGGRWVSFAANRHLYNRQGQLSVGQVLDRDGDVLSWTEEDGARRWYDNSTVRKATLHAVGDAQGNIGTGALVAFADQLSGYNLLTGAYSPLGAGNDLYLTLDARYNYIAYEALAGRKGAVGVYNYETGEVLCMVSAPAFDPLNPPSAEELEENDAYEGAYLNRFLSGTFPPGSVYKTVVLSAAIERMPDLFDRTWTCTGSTQVGDGAITCPHAHGEQDISSALANSCNGVFALLAGELGEDVLEEYTVRAGLTSSYRVSGLNTAAGSFDFDGLTANELGWAGVGHKLDYAHRAWIQPGHWLTSDMQKANEDAAALYESWKKDVQVEEYRLEDAEVVLTAYGISARICKSAVELLRAQGVKAGLIRPITVHPFPYAAYDHIDYSKVKAVLDVEMSIPAQFVDDVAVAVKDRCLIETCLCSGGNIMSRDKVLAAVKKIMEGK